MPSRALEILVGFFVCLGVAAVIALTFRVAGSQGAGTAPTYEVTAAFDNIGKLSAGAPIKIAGVTVGRVAGISVDKTSFQAVVRMDIQDTFNTIPDDSSASILTAGILGEQYVGIDPGGSDTSLKQGSKIPLTQSAMILEKLIGQLVTSMTKGKDDSSTPAASNVPAAKPAAPAATIPAPAT